MANTKVKAEQLEAAQTNITSLGTLTSLTVDDITINGSTISDAADLTIDVGGDIILDADGGEVQFLDGGTAIGSIAAHTGSLIIGGGDVGIGFYQGANALVPYNGVSALRDSAIDLGMASSGRFKDLYLSGGITCTTLTPSGRLSFGEHIIGSTATGYLQLTSGSGKAWAMSQGGGGAPGTDRNAFGIHHWNGSAWSNPLTIDANGHAGITSTPPAWGAAYTALTVGSSGALWCSKSGTSLTTLADNTYFDGSNQIARNTQAGAQYYMNAGSHVWQTAPSVSAGANQTFVTTMQLGSGGHLSVGSNSRNDDCIYLYRSGTGKLLRFYGGGSEVGYISTNTYQLPSDRNFKKDIEDLTLGLDFVKDLKPKQYRQKIEDSDVPLQTGLIAQDVEESLTAAGVSKNKYMMLQHTPNEDEGVSQYGIDYGKIIPILINAIQELSAKLEAK